MSTTDPWITIAVPSYNQGQFLGDALASIFQQNLPVEVFVLDGGSTDNSLEIIRSWEHRLAGWRSYPDDGQAAAINEGIAQGSAPFVCWLNSDDLFLPNGLTKLLEILKQNPRVPAVYGRSWSMVEASGKKYPTWVEAFSEKRLTLRCIISQPATLIRRTAWEAVGGVDATLNMAMDYDLWWKLFKLGFPLQFVNDFVAVNREHKCTKTNTKRRQHYQEAIAVVRKYHGHVPLKWWLGQPYAVWFKSIINFFHS